MLEPLEWQMLQEAVRHRARVWRDQAYSARNGSQKIHCEKSAYRLEEIARRIAAHMELQADTETFVDDSELDMGRRAIAG